MMGRVSRDYRKAPVATRRRTFLAIEARFRQAQLRNVGVTFRLTASSKCRFDVGND